MDIFHSIMNTITLSRYPRMTFSDNTLVAKAAVFKKTCKYFKDSSLFILLTYLTKIPQRMENGKLKIKLITKTLSLIRINNNLQFLSMPILGLHYKSTLAWCMFCNLPMHFVFIFLYSPLLRCLVKAVITLTKSTVMRFSILLDLRLYYEYFQH